MAINLEPYKRMLAGARRELEASMAGGTASAFTIAVQRGAVAIMAEDLDKRPQTLAAYESRTQNGLTGPDLWLVAARKKTAAPLSPKEVEPEAFWAKTQEYMQIIQVLKERYTTAAHLLVDRKNMHAYLVQENDHVKQALADIAAAMAQWVAVHYADDGFLTAPAIDGLHRMLSERQDLLVTLRVAQQLPKDTNTFVIPPEQRPAALEIIEFGIACIPVVGTAVAIFEATFGYDLFGYELNPVDRVVIAAGAVLPFAGRFVKGGHALYTAARMERLYGQEAARWSLALAAGEKMSEDVVARTAISRARAAIKAGQKVEPALARQVVSALERMALKRGSPRGMPIASYVSDSLKKLISARSVLAELDELTLARVIEKGPNISLMKGQLLEEFLETRVAAWLRDPAGARALGITIPPPHNLEFIPGHLIRDSAGRQITNGVLGYRHNGELITVAIFEAKAGSAAARELRLASSSISSLSAADRAELRAYARDILGSRINRARLRGEKFPKTATRSIAHSTRSNGRSP